MLNTSYSHIRAFEKQLTDDGYVLLKYFVHVSKKQQKENMEKLNKVYGKNWKNWMFRSITMKTTITLLMLMSRCLPKLILKMLRGI